MTVRLLVLLCHQTPPVLHDPHPDGRGVPPLPVPAQLQLLPGRGDLVSAQTFPLRAEVQAV